MIQQVKEIKFFSLQKHCKTKKKIKIYIRVHLINNALLKTVIMICLLLDIIGYNLDFVKLAICLLVRA